MPFCDNIKRVTVLQRGRTNAHLICRIVRNDTQIQSQSVDVDAVEGLHAHTEDIIAQSVSVYFWMHHDTSPSHSTCVARQY